nr:hypothetical protein [Tanacetum cinerariifolium]
MNQDSAHMVVVSKVPMLKPSFEIWRMRIEQYIQMMDYALWEVIENEKAQRRLEVKARSTLMMGIPNEHQLKFISIKDAKQLLEAVEKRFEDMNQDSAHMVVVSKVPMLKPSFEIWRMRIEQYIQMMDYALWEVIENEKAQRRLEVKARSTLMMGIPNEHQLKFISIKDAKQLLEAVEKRFGENAVTKKTQRNLLKQQSKNFYASSTKMLDQTFDRLLIQPNSPQLLHEDLEQIYPDDIKEMDLRCQMAMLTMRTRRFLKKTERKLTLNGNETLGFDTSKVECYNCYKRGHFARECRASRNQDFKHKESTRRTVPVEAHASTSLVSCDGLGGYDWSDQAEEGPNYALIAYTSISSHSKNEFIYLEDIKVLKVEIQMKEIAIKELRRKLEVARKEKDRIQLTVEKLKNASKRNFMPSKPDLSFNVLDEFANKPIAENTKSSEVETKEVRKNVDALIIKKWVLDN